MASACGRAGEWKQAALAKLSNPVWCGAHIRRAKWSQLETSGAEFLLVDIVLRGSIVLVQHPRKNVWPPKLGCNRWYHDIALIFVTL